MPQIGFYHLTRTSVQEALPQLLDRTLASGERAVISCASDEEMKNLDRTLWESRHYFWLPHGAEGNSDEESHAVRQPIWLSVRTEAPANGARFLFRLNGAPTAPLAGFVRIFDLFNGQDEQSVAEARKRWKEFRQAGYSLAYWKQEAKGWRQAG
ncbi:DNA polymerase III subunit chi [Acetobacteraceae bacterium ESL0709]|nr:DNA polymerase III subunit chi [Acetobacteraceae bacterium ESL0697]MDF7678583.1 DNA polymerase III subunit chi [Acetobacteraceae bacterium ESL0709]